MFDRFGAEGMQQRGVAAKGGMGNSRAAWDEFKVILFVVASRSVLLLLRSI